MNYCPADAPTLRRFWDLAWLPSVSSLCIWAVDGQKPSLGEPGVPQRVVRSGGSAGTKSATEVSSACAKAIIVRSCGLAGFPGRPSPFSNIW